MVPATDAKMALLEACQRWRGATKVLDLIQRVTPRRSVEITRGRRLSPYPLRCMSEQYQPPADDGAGEPENVINQERATGDARDADAFGAGFGAPPDQSEVQSGVRGGEEGRERPPSTADFTRLTARDRAVVHDAVLLRLLTYEQVHRRFFDNVGDRTTVRRRLRHLERAGWLHSWEEPTRRGGHTRYIHPTAIALRSVLPTCVTRAETEPWAPLVKLMVPRSARRELGLEEAAPKWLAHQREVNHLVTSLVTVPPRRIVWASSWDCPFPSRAGMFTLPQPDYVLVEDYGGMPRLIFGEHDRASEPVDRFVARKVALYSALAAFPEVCEQLFGVRSFSVFVTTIDPIAQHPIARLRALSEATRVHGAPDIFRFTLGGWLHAYPSAPVWFTASDTPATESVAWSDHAPALVAA